MKQILIFLLLSLPLFAQNLKYESFTCANNDSIITLDLAYDWDRIISEYSAGNEFRAIGLWFDGTWTNTTFTVLACTSSTGTFDPVYDESGTALTITMASNRWIWLKPIEFAGLRYVKLRGAVKEGGARAGVIIKRLF